MNIQSRLVACGLGALGVCVAGCSSVQSADDAEYVNSPMGYVSPDYMDQGVPIQVGPNPAYGGTSGSPNIYIPAAAPPLNIVADQGGFTPASFAVRPGQLVTIHLVNRTSQPQNFMLDASGTKIKTRSVPPGAIDTLQFTAPIAPGSYRFYSPGADERHAIEGTLIVLAPQAPARPLSQP